MLSQELKTAYPVDTSEDTVPLDSMTVFGHLLLVGDGLSQDLILSVDVVLRDPSVDESHVLLRFLFLVSRGAPSR